VLNSEDKRNLIEETRAERRCNKQFVLAAGDTGGLQEPHNKLDGNRDRLEELLEKRTAELSRATELLERERLEHAKVEEELKVLRLRVSSLIEQTTDAVFCYEYDPPIPVDLPIEDQIRSLYDGVLVECNDVCAKSYGAERAEEVIGRKLTDLFATAPASLDKLFEELVRGNYRIVDGESVEKIQDGTERHYLSNVYGVIEEGKLIRVLGAFRDVTDHRRVQEALRESENRYRIVVDNAGDGVVVVQDRMLRFVNSSLIAILGYSGEESISRPFIEFIHPDDREKVMDIHIRRLQGEQVPGVYEFRILDRQGNAKWVENNGILIEWDGRPATLNFLRDITERKLVAHELEDRLGFERLVSMISAELIAVQADQIDSAVEKGLKLVGEYFDVDRVSIGQIVNRREDTRTMHIWLSDEYDAQLNVLARECTYPNVDLYLQRNNAFVYGSLDKVPSDWTEERRFATAAGIKAGVIVRLSIGDKFLGAISMNSLRAERIWPDKTIQHLRFIGEIFANVLNRNRAEEELREKQRFSEKLLDGMLTSVGVLDPCGAVIFMNNTPLNAAGFELGNIKGKKFYDAPWWSYSDEARETIKHDIEQCASGKTLAHDIQIQTADGSLMWIEYSMHPIIDEHGVVKYLISEGRDITEYKQAEQRILKNQAQLKSLASQLSRIEERERHRLATALHDQVGQSLVFSKLKLDQLRMSDSGGEIAEALEEVCGYLGQAIQETRTLTFDLSSPILYEVGFEAAVAEWLADEIRGKCGIETEFYDDVRQKPLDDDIRALLFRNVRELLINVVKHAQASKVKVCVQRADEDVCVSVEDDGVGFNPAEVKAVAAKSNKFGLFSIRERLEQLGGRIEIDSVPGRGSKILMMAPLKCETLTDGMEP